MTDKNDLILFKQECRDYFVYQGTVRKIDEELMDTEVRIRNVRSPKMEKIGSTPSPHEQDLLKLIELKTEYENQKAYYEYKLDWIGRVVDAIPSPAYKAMTWMTCVQGKNKRDIALTYDVSSEYVYKTRDKFLLIALSDQLMAEYRWNEARKPASLDRKML